MSDQNILDALCNDVVAASEILSKGDGDDAMFVALTNLAKAAGPGLADQVQDLSDVIYDISCNDEIFEKADAVFGAVSEFRNQMIDLAKGDAPELVEPTAYDVMFGALRKSVMSILDVAQDADKEGLLDTTLGQFGDALGKQLQTDVAEAHSAGVMTKFDGSKDDLAKGMDHVAGFALIMHQIEYFLSTWADEVQEETAEGADHAMQQAGGTTQSPPKGLIAAAQWYQLGQEVLKVLVEGTAGEDQQGADDDQSQQDDGSNPEEDGNQQDEPPPPPAKAPPPPPNQPQQRGFQPQQRRPFGKSDEAAPQQSLDKGDQGDLKKVDEALAKVEAVSAENAELRKQLDELRKQPAPAKGVTIGIPKQADAVLKGDVSEADLLKKAEELSKMSDQDRALALIKMAPARAFSTPGIPV